MKKNIALGMFMAVLAGMLFFLKGAAAEERMGTKAFSGAVPSVLEVQGLGGNEKKIALNRTKLTLEKGGESYLVLSKAPSKKIKWISSNKKVAAVSKAGKVTAREAGTSTITAVYNKKKYRCRVTVMEPLLMEPGYSVFSGYLRGAGRLEKGYNGREFIQSEAANSIYRSLYYYAAYGLSRQDDPAIVSYWESMGLKKQVYDAGDPDRMWSVFVPTGLPLNKGSRLPVVFCLHGHNNNILLAETYGFAKLGGSEGFITVVPWAKDEDIIVEEVPRILDILRKEKYPIDESRIYAAGFSKGGMAAQTVALKYSDLFAAVAPGGCAPLGEDEYASPITSGNLNWGFRTDEFKNANTMPVLFFGGSCDSMPVDTDAVNAWIGLSGADAPEMAESWFGGQSSASNNDVERYTGLRYQSEGQMETRRYDGQNYYIGSYYNEDGICTFRAVSVEGAPHWVMPSEAAVIWEFLSQFARNTDSHELAYSGTRNNTPRYVNP